MLHLNMVKDYTYMHIIYVFCFTMFNDISKICEIVIYPRGLYLLQYNTVCIVPFNRTESNICNLISDKRMVSGSITWCPVGLSQANGHA